MLKAKRSPNKRNNMFDYHNHIEKKNDEPRSLSRKENLNNLTEMVRWVELSF